MEPLTNLQSLKSLADHAELPAFARPTPEQATHYRIPLRNYRYHGMLLGPRRGILRYPADISAKFRDRFSFRRKSSKDAPAEDSERPALLPPYRSSDGHMSGASEGMTIMDVTETHTDHLIE